MKASACLLVVGLTVHEVLAPGRNGQPAPQTWYDGYWTVAELTRNGQEVAEKPGVTTRWQRLRFVTDEGKIQARWRNTDDSYGPLLDVTFAPDGTTMTWALAEPDTSHPAASYAITYRRVDASHLELDGQIDGDHVQAKLETLDPRRMLLVTRGFHWINEVPFNR